MNKRPQDYANYRPMTTGQTAVVAVCCMIAGLCIVAALFETAFK